MSLALEKSKRKENSTGLAAQKPQIKANAVSKTNGKLDNVIAVSLALLEASC